MKPEHETVIDRAERLAEVKICSVCQQVIDHPELRGTSWGKKDNSVGFYSMSFSATLIQIAGGIDKLFSEWEQRE